MGKNSCTGYRIRNIRDLSFAVFIAALVIFTSCRNREVSQDGKGFMGAYAPSEHWQPPADSLARIKLNEFQNLKFGFLICWGTQTQMKTIDQSWVLCPERYEWNKRPAPYENADDSTFRKAYEALMTTFNPVKFDPDKIAGLAAESGVRYMIFVTKHHDGFCFWDTKTTDYKITSPDCPFSSNPHADVTRALFDAFRRKNIPTSVYFSKPDWHTPWYWAPQFGPPTSRNNNYSTAEHPEVWEKFKNFTKEQIRELMTKYGPVDILWLDGGQVQPGNNQDIDMPGIARMARELQPGLLVVDRTAGGGYEDFLTPEGTGAMPVEYQPDAWEACIHFGDRWAWTENSKYYSSGTLIRYLVKAVARNGNLLLGLGPDDQGAMDPVAVNILKELGNWLNINGEAIYETRPVSPYEMGNLFFTQKPDGTIYAIALSNEDGEPMPGSITLPAELVREPVSITMVGGDVVPLVVRPGNTPETVVADIPPDIKPPAPDSWAFKISKGK